MSAPIVRKLGRISDGAKTSYFLMPPKFWLDSVERNEGRKILQLAIKAEAFALVMSPVFDQPEGDQPRNSSPEEVLSMLEEGTLVSKLREVRKGKNVYRIVNLPRVWIREREAGTNRKLTALSIITQSDCITVEPIFGEKLKQR